MISKEDLNRLLQRPDGEAPVLSLFLDLSVNSDNKRKYSVFLNQKEAQLAELDPRRREEIHASFQRVREWIASEFDEQNRGAAVYADVAGSWFEAVQFPVVVQNRAVLAPRPSIGPLAQVLESYHHHGVVLLDREHVRIMSVYLGTLLEEYEVRREPMPGQQDVQAGGYSHSRYQRHKIEEMRHFFRDFAKEVEEFVARFRPHDLVILGTDENVARFREFLPQTILDRVVYTGPAQVDETVSDVLARISPHLQAHEEEERKGVVELVRDRVAHDYLATAGFHGTLTALQEGKVETLVVARDQQIDGTRCTQCAFLFASELTRCPYCGSEQLDGVDAIEEMVRLAEDQGVTISFAEPDEVEDLRGVGALLRF